MAGKAKPTKHTTKEINKKHHDAKMKNGGKGGGEEGKDKRKAPKEGKKDVMMKCEKCMVMQPGVKSMAIHYENKHPKDDWNVAIKLYVQEEIVEETGNDTNYNYEYKEEEEKVEEEVEEN